MIPLQVNLLRLAAGGSLGGDLGALLARDWAIASALLLTWVVLAVLADQLAGREINHEQQNAGAEPAETGEQR